MKKYFTNLKLNVVSQSLNTSHKCGQIVPPPKTDMIMKTYNNAITSHSKIKTIRVGEAASETSSCS